MFWYQDPLSLKEDVSRILRDVVERPFLSLKKELFENAEWRDIVFCLALSPSMFVNTRALLHKWFLQTGLASVFELLAGLVSAIMDTISRPSWWGIPMELASMLPFSDAYFPLQCQFLRIFAGPFNSKSLILLAQTISEPVYVPGKPRLDDKSEWALAINFPDWFYFASSMIFSKGNSLGSIQQACDVEGVSIAAATYIAWLLKPVSGTIQESLSKSLIRVSEIFTSKSCGSEGHRSSESITGKRKKPDRIKASSNVKDMVREFHNEIANSVDRESDSSQKTHPSGFQNNLLVRRVVIGVLIGSPSSVTDQEYELVLHYAATGKILATKKRAKSVSKISALLSNEITKEEAIEGIGLVFNLTETLESMCVSSFEAEEDAEEFVNRFKLRSSKYLVKCIDQLIQLHCQEDGDTILNDLNIRLLQWTIQGREETQIDKDVDIIAARLACVLLPV